MAFNAVLIFPIRILQVVFAIIVLGVLAYAAHNWAWYWSPSEINFLIFTSIWTLIAVAYLVIAPGRFPTAAHHYGIMAAEAVTMIFWFAGFIALAVLLNNAGCSARTGQYWGPCRAAIAGDVFAAFEWLLFAATTAIATLEGWRSRDGTGVKHSQATGV